MTLPFRFAITPLILIALAWSGAAFAYPGTNQPDSTLASLGLGKGFTLQTTRANGTLLCYVRGGRGPGIILLHGFPEDWSEFRKVMPSLTAKFTVIAVDLRGVGCSSPQASGYDVATLAQDIHQLAQALKLKRPYIVGHDIGGMVAYAYARLFPKATRGVMIVDVPLPGIAPWKQVERDPLLWHFAFHQTPKVPEELISGRQFVYIRDTFFARLAFNKSAISNSDIARYANAYGTPSQLHAGLGFYRAFPADEKFGETHHNRIDVPVALVGGDHATGKMEPQIARSLRQHGCTKVSVAVVENSGHFVADEQPARLTALVQRNAAPWATERNHR